jgi:hypothetical protein
MAKRATKRSDASRLPSLVAFGARTDRLLYEVLMLGNTAALLDEEAPLDEGWRELTQSMAVVESFLAHAGSLLDFLYPPKRVVKHNRRKRGEIFAFDYCRPGWQAGAWEDLGAVRKAIQRDLAHLSLAELPATSVGEYARMVAMLRRALAGFLEHADGMPGQTKAQIRTALERERARGRLIRASRPATSTAATSVAGTPVAAAPAPRAVG